LAKPPPFLKMAWGGEQAHMTPVEEES
jgi:hypothetical protein